jgi:Fe-S-cluster-containing dehydrogenase component
MSNISRRGFLKGAAAAGGALFAAASPVRSAPKKGKGEKVAMLIDLTKCDGCASRGTPACVETCRSAHANRFPEPEKPVKDYWPQKKHEDWSGKRHLTDTLTPYNWTFVQKTVVRHNGEDVELHIPRHCMHCDNPPCANLCPVGANTKSPEGAVLIDDGLCLGGAKCRSVCPWHIPQRQAGVGIYLNFDPAAGGGVMYKCDLCHDRITSGGEPACVEACRKIKGEGSALAFGRREDIIAEAQRRAAATGGHIYGLEENGGTSTLYVSNVPFAKIDEALAAGKEKFRMPKAKNPMEKESVKLKAALIAPLAGFAGAMAAAGRAFSAQSKNKERSDEVR